MSAVADQPTAETLLAGARAIQPELAERSAEFEQARRLPQELSDRLAGAGYYRIMTPEAYGGLELRPDTALEIFETLAIGDAAAAWVTFIAATTGTTLARLPEADAREIFATPETMLCGVFAPRGTAVREAGGFRVNGRWQWGSGTENADWVAGGCMIVENGEQTKAQHMMLAPKADIEFLDTWHVSGLCGTGSTDFQMTDIFVPEGRAVGFVERQNLDRPLYLFPQFCLLALGIAGVALGTARKAIDTLTQLAVEKTPTGQTKPFAERAQTQSDVALAEARLRSARLFLYDAVGAAWEKAVAGDKVPVEQRRDMRLATSYAVQNSVQVVDAMYNLGGGTSVYSDNVLQRCFRDVHVATQHIMVAPPTFELTGRLFLGLETNTATL